MKNKEAISAIVGTTFFAIPYLGLSATLTPSLLIGVAAYGASHLIFSGTNKKSIESIAKNTKEELKKAISESDELAILSKKLENQETQKNLNDIVDTVNKIIKTIQKNPQKMKQVENFFDYYLPVLLKIVTRYDEIENQSLSSKEGKKFILSANSMIEEANSSFKKVLSSLYQSDIVDADAEMKVFNSMLKIDGLSEEIDIKERSKKNE